MRALVIRSVCRCTSSFVLPLLDTHPPDIIGIDPYFPAAMRQLARGLAPLFFIPGP